MAAIYSNRLSDLRKAAGFTQQALAEAVGIHWITISKLERGKIKLTVDWMNKLSPYLNATPREMIEQDVDEPAVEATKEKHDRLRVARQSAGYSSATEAARANGWVVGTYLSHENGTRGIKHAEVIRYAGGFSVEPSWIEFGKGSDRPLHNGELDRHQKASSIIDQPPIAPEDLRRWIVGVCDLINAKPSVLAREAGLAASTINRFLSDFESDKGLNSKTVRAIQLAAKRLERAGASLAVRRDAPEGRGTETLYDRILAEKNALVEKLERLRRELTQTESELKVLEPVLVALAPPQMGS